MGSEDLFHKRKKDKNLQRNKAKRAPYDKVLIVCEGAKTEPYYLNGLISRYRINTANIRIVGEECGSDPCSVVNKAIEIYHDTEKTDPFDKIFCVVDQDNHPNYLTAKQIVSNSPLNRSKQILHFIDSVPCFEYWLLLHYEKTAKPYHQTGKKSVADKAIDDLKRYIPNYVKGNQDICDFFTDQQITFAINNGKFAEEEALKNNTDMPSTKMYQLVEYLKQIKV